MSSSKKLLACLALLVLCGSTEATMRVWRDKQGNTFVGEFVREKFGKFTFRDSDKQVKTVAMEDLVDADVDFIRNLIPPKIDAELKVKDELVEYPPEAFAGGSGTIEQYDLFTTLTVKRRSSSPYGGILRGEIYLVAQEVETDHMKMVLKETFPIQFKDDSKEFVYTTIGEAYRYGDYYDEDRGNEYLGYAFFIYAPDGSLLSTDSNLSFLKDDKFESFRNLNQGNFFMAECRKLSVPRPGDHYFTKDGDNSNK